MGINVFPQQSTKSSDYFLTGPGFTEGVLTSGSSGTISCNIPVGDYAIITGKSGTVTTSDGGSYTTVANTPIRVSATTPITSATLSFPASQAGASWITAATTGGFTPLGTSYPLTTQTGWGPAVSNWAYGNGIIVNIGLQTTYYTSTDGLAWTSRTFPTATTISISFAGGLFFAGQRVDANTGTNALYTSPDGITWTLRTLPTGQNLITNVVYASGIGGGTYVANSISTTTYNPSNVIHSSTNGTSWTARTLPSSAFWGSVAATSTRFVVVAFCVGNLNSAISTTSIAATSTDGTNWTSSTLPGAGYNPGVIAIGSNFLSKFIAAGNNYYTSNGTSWTSGGLNNAGGDVASQYYGSPGIYPGTSGGSAGFIVPAGGTTTSKFTTDGISYISLGTAKNISFSAAFIIYSGSEFTATTGTAAYKSVFSPTSFGIYPPPSATY
jgi:hypothetical protein